MAKSKIQTSVNDAGGDENFAEIQQKPKWHRELLLILINMPCCLVWMCITIWRYWTSEAEASTFDDDMELFERCTTGYLSTKDYREHFGEVCRNFLTNGKASKALWNEAIYILESNDERKAQYFVDECNTLPNTASVNAALAFVCTATLSYENEVACFILSNIRTDVLTEAIHRGSLSGLTLIHCAVNSKQTLHVKLILQRFEGNTKELVNSVAKVESCKTLSWQTPLFIAIRQRDIPMIKLLIKHGADLSETDAFGNNALHVAVLEGNDDHEVAETLIDVLLSEIPKWMQLWLTFDDETLLTHLYKEHAATFYLTRKVNSDGFTPLVLATKLGCENVANKLLNLAGVYSFGSPYGCISNQTYYDVSEIDPLCYKGSNRCSILELLVTQYNSGNLSCLSIPAIHNVIEVKKSHYIPFLACFGLFHTFFIVSFNVVAYIDLFPRTMHSFNGNKSESGPEGNTMFEFTVIDYLAAIVCCCYLMQAIVITHAVWQLSKKTRLSFIDKIYMSSCMDLGISLTFAVSCGLYLILKGINSEVCVYFLAITLLIGWIRTLLFTKIIRKLAFFSIMYTGVLSGEIFRFLFLILGLVVAFSMAACCIFYYEITNGPSSENVIENHSRYLFIGNVMLSYTQLAVGISDFEFLSESTHAFNYVLYIMFLIGTNVVLFNLLIAAMNTEYSNIANRADLLCQQILIRDIVVLESILPLSLKMPITKLYKCKRVKLLCQYNGSNLPSGPDNVVFLHHFSS